MADDHGYFGPDSISWRVNQEMTVLFGGARALLMHAAHPLVAAGARQTSMYQRDPWARLLRTLQMQSTMTFGTRAESDEAAERINRLHYKVNGIDPVTGERYDAVDPALLLWVHACLEVSSLYFFERTVRPLSPPERDRYHHENLVAADLMLLPRERVPADYAGTEAYVAAVIASDRLQVTDVAENVADIIRQGPVPTIIKPLWGFIRFAAFGTLPPKLRMLYGVKWSPGRQRWLDLNLNVLGIVRPFLPERFRLIGPARWAMERLAGKHNLTLAEASARRKR
ncbi:MAG TPA: oxygenase MpaB family protein [Acidimicrobiia bacterium]|nr:oxygenase MpaB family protein [Acidimicrobiia bacterium]